MARYFEEWDENTDISWWADGRKRLNVIIRAFNDWQREGQIEGFHDAKKAREIVADIDEAKQTWASKDGASGWLEVLEEMERLVHDV